MRIAVNTRLLLENKLDGIGWFSFESLKRITQQHPEHEFIFIFDGYFSSFNQMTETEAQMSGDHSNECEMLYMSCYPVDPVATSSISVLSHELQHLIHFGYDADEESWVDEGCAEYAMVLCGYPDPITSFPQNPEDNLTVWDQEWADYVQTMLFFTYLSEQTTGPAFLKELVAESANSVTGIENILTSISYPLDFQEILSNWAVANYVDDTIDGGLYNYDVFDVPTFSYDNYFTTYPADEFNTLPACAARYYKLSATFERISIVFDYPIGSEWDLRLLAFDDNGDIQEVLPFTNFELDFVQPTSYTLGNLILVVTNKEISEDETSYSFDISETSGINDNISKNNISIFPNPTKDKINVISSVEKELNISILDIKGEIVYSGKTNSGIIDVSKIIPGSYILKLSNDELIKYEKLIIR